MTAIMSKHFPLDHEPTTRHHDRTGDNSGCMPRQRAVASALNLGGACENHRQQQA